MGLGFTGMFQGNRTMAEPSDRTKPQEEAAIAGPGVIAGQQVDPQSGARGIASGPLPDVTGPSTHHIGEIAVGTPGMGTNQADIRPATSGMSGQTTNDQSPAGAQVTGKERDETPPDTLENPRSA